MTNTIRNTNKVKYGHSVRTDQTEETLVKMLFQNSVRLLEMVPVRLEQMVAPIAVVSTLLADCSKT